MCDDILHLHCEEEFHQQALVVIRPMTEEEASRSGCKASFIMSVQVQYRVCQMSGGSVWLSP